MSAPSNTVFQNGQNQVSGDQLNTFVQGSTNVSTLRSFIGVTGMTVYISGTSSPGDGGQGTFYWNSTGTGPDDNGSTNVVPNGVAIGCWTRLPSSALGSISSGYVLANITGSAASPVGVGLSSLIDNVFGNTQGNILYRNASAWTVLPPGTSGQLLQSGGASANPSWAGATLAISKVVVQKFTNSATYTPTSGMLYCQIWGIGGGGGGGGVSATVAAAGGGGAAGSEAKLTASASTIGSSQSVTIGAGGLAGTNSGGTGGTGGTTSVGSLISCPGGLGGVGSTSSNNNSNGGAGQGATGGDINGTGAPGGNSGGMDSDLRNFSGFGGSSSVGGGGLSIAGAGATAANGNNGVANTGGGGSGANAGAGSAKVGGTGGSGIVIITEYCS